MLDIPLRIIQYFVMHFAICTLVHGYPELLLSQKKMISQFSFSLSLNDCLDEP